MIARWFRAAALAAALAVGWAGAAHADDDPGGPERILSFDSAIDVEADGEITVTETITVVARGERIRRGIFRDLPLDRPSGYGRTVSDLDVLSVRRDGRDEAYRTERDGDTVRITIGNADVLLADGVHTYELVYALDKQIGFFPDYDEIYWNVTGDRWAFTIEKATATVIPPVGTKVLSTAAYTGPFGARGTAFIESRDAAGDPVFTTTAPLPPGEGLTVAVSWPKGVVAEPTAIERFYDEMKPTIVAGLSLLAVLVYYLWAWRQVGVDPAAGPVVPVYAPTLAPDAMRILDRGGYDPTCLAAALVDAAVRGHLLVEDRPDGATVLTRIDGAKPLTPSETLVLDGLFGAAGGRVALSGPANTKVARTDEALKSHLREKVLDVFIRRNYLWFAVGLLLSLAGWVLTGLTVSDSETAMAAPVVTMVATVLIAFVGSAALSAWRAVMRGKISMIPTAFGTSFFTIFAFVFWAGSSLAYVGTVGLAACVLLIVAAVLNVVFFRLLQAPTAAGRKALDEVAGTRLYLTVAEADRLKFHNPPDRTPAHFEAMLPYAVALGVETAWGEQFRTALAAAAGPLATAPQPAWYHGSSGRGGIGDFGSTFSGRVKSAVQAGAAAIAAASARSSGSGGSSGGGSSGGGGGGGGGGGW